MCVGGGGLEAGGGGGGSRGGNQITIITFCSYICLGNAWGGYINISPYHVFTLIFSIAIEKNPSHMSYVFDLVHRILHAFLYVLY